MLLGKNVHTYNLESEMLDAHGANVFQWEMKYSSRLQNTTLVAHLNSQFLYVVCPTYHRFYIAHCVALLVGCCLARLH